MRVSRLSVRDFMREADVMRRTTESSLCQEKSKRSCSERFSIEDCAESFLVVAQPPPVPFREGGNFGFTRCAVGRPRARQLRFVDTAMFRFP